MPLVLPPLSKSLNEEAEEEKDIGSVFLQSLPLLQIGFRKTAEIMVCWPQKTFVETSSFHALVLRRVTSFSVGALLLRRRRRDMITQANRGEKNNLSPKRETRASGRIG